MPEIPNQREQSMRDIFSMSEADSFDHEELSPSYSQLLENESPYQDKTLIGKGALKEVSQVYDSRTQRFVAYAELQDQLDESFYEAFIHEAWLVSQLNHPNIIKIYEVNVNPESKKPFFTMDLKSNRDYRHLVNEETDIRVRLSAFMRICDAIAYAHAHNTIHLDLKPENIQCEHFGELVVCDWGLGRQLNEDADLEVSHTVFSAFDTLYGKVRGTPGYMAPEQISLSQPKDERTDIFSLGALLYFTLFATPPFPGQHEIAMNNTLAGEWNRNHKPLYKGQSALISICDTAMQTDPALRYQCVTDLKADVERYLAGYTVSVERKSWLKVGLLFLKRHRKLAAVTSLSLLAILLISLLSMSQINSRDLIIDDARESTYALNQKMLELDAEYDLFESTVSSSKNDLAQKLNKAGQIAVLNAITTSHTEAEGKEFAQNLEIAKSLLSKATNLQTSPISAQSRAYSYWVLAHFLTLDFSTILTKECRSDSPRVQTMYKCAEKFPTYNFSIHQRPSSSELYATLDHLLNQKKLNPQHFEALVRLQLEGKSIQDKNQCMLYILQYFNRDNKSFRGEIAPDTSTLSIHSNQKIHYNTAVNSFDRVINEFHVNKIRISGKKLTMKLEHINFIKVDHLDLSKLDDITTRSSTLNFSSIGTLQLPARSSLSPDVIKVLELSQKAGQVILSYTEE